MLAQCALPKHFQNRTDVLARQLPYAVGTYSTTWTNMNAHAFSHIIFGRGLEVRQRCQNGI
jgi:hypothetical protein